MKKHHDSANEDRALDELSKRNVKRGMNYHNGPEYAEHESQEISRRILTQKSGAKKRDASSTEKYKSGLVNGRRYMTDDQVAKYNTCRAANISPSIYVKYSSAKYTYGNGNGSWTQDELKSWLDSQNLTTEQKRVLWTVTNSGWKSNPYS